MPWGYGALRGLWSGGACRESSCIFSPIEPTLDGTQAEVLQPETIAKLIEQPERPGHRRIGRGVLMCRLRLSDMANVMNHEVGT